MVIHPLLKRTRLHFQHAILLKMAACLLPTLIWYWLKGDPLILHAGLFATSLQQIAASYHNISFRFLVVLSCAMLLSTSLVFLSLNHAVYTFVVTITILAAACSALSIFGELWKNIGIYLFIPALYLGYETAHATTSGINNTALVQLLKAFPLSFVSVYLVNIGWQKWRARQPHAMNKQANWRPSFKINAKTWQEGWGLTQSRTLSVAVAACYVGWYQPALGQWVIWSATSVALGDSIKSWNKGKQRLQGGIFGLILGLALAFSIPYQAWIGPVCIMGSALTLSGIQPYSAAFGLRCMFIVIIAGSSGYALDTATARLTDVAFGALIGFTVTSILDSIHRYVAKKPKP